MRRFKRSRIFRAACLLAALLCAVSLFACSQRRERGEDAAKTPEQMTAAPDSMPTEAAGATPFPEPTLCPGMHSALMIVTGDNSPGEDDVEAYRHVIAETRTYPDGRTEEADGRPFTELYREISGELPRVCASERFVVYPPDFPGYGAHSTESVKVCTENENGELEELRVLSGTEELLGFIETEWDGANELIVDYAVRYGNRYDFGEGSLSTGLEGWAFIVTP